MLIMEHTIRLGNDLRKLIDDTSMTHTPLTGSVLPWGYRAPPLVLATLVA